MSRLTHCLPVLLLSVFLSLLGQQVGLADSPGPDATAESKSYDVTATSQTLAGLSGTFVFVGDPDRPQRSESGDFQASLALTDDATATPVESSGNWWSRDFWFFCFWLAQADAVDDDFRMFSLGVVWNTDLYGSMYVYGGTTIAQGRYRIKATVTVEEPPPTEPTATTN